MNFFRFLTIGALVWFFTANLSALRITSNSDDELSQCKTGQYVKIVQLTDTTCKVLAMSDHPSASELVIDTVEVFIGSKRLAVVEICDFALWGHDDIRKLTLGPSVERIGGMMCHLCEGLTEVVIEGHIDSIPADAFHGCKSLRRVTNGGEEMTLEGNTPVENQMPEPAMVKEDEEGEGVVYHTVE